MKKFAWLNLTTGEFSNTWTEEDMKHKDDYLRELIQYSNTPYDGSIWKLLSYECLNDDGLEFFNCMKLS